MTDAKDLSPQTILRSTEYPTNEAGWPTKECKACRAAVIFVETLAGKRQILDAEPSPRGNIGVEDRGPGRLIASVFSGANLESMRRLGRPLYIDHHATCPEADSFRG